MGNKDKYTAADFIEAIPGSGGIISTIAARVGCDWRTSKKYCHTYPTVKVAYDEECERNKDLAESVVLNNIRAAYKEQQNSQFTAQVDSADSKWFLTKKANERGYTDRREITGADGGPLLIKGYAGISPDDWDADESDTDNNDG